MRSFFLILLLPIFAYSSIFEWFSPLSTKAQRARDVLENFDPIVEKALKDFQFPGVTIGVVVDGHIVYAKGFGYRDVEKKLPMTPDTLLAVGSFTKGFTSFLIGTFVDEALIAWDQPVIDILPEFRLFDDYATHNITFRDLLTHRTGLPRHDLMWYNTLMSRPELLHRIRYLEPSADIRERYQYNNLAYFVAGYALERATGKTWEELITSRIMMPLDMKQTNFSTTEMQKTSNFAYGYIEKKGQLKKMPFRNISLIGPAGSMNSNIVDLMHWVKLNLNQGVFNNLPLISPATLQEIQSPQVIIPGVPESKETLISAYGIGWTVVAYRGHYFISHDGISDGFTSVIGLLPNEKMGFVVLGNKNLASLPRYLSFQLVDQMLELPKIDWLKEGLDSVHLSQEVSRERTKTEDVLRKKGTSPSHPLEDYVGEYSHSGYGKIFITLVDGQLQVTYNDITALLEHWHYDVFSLCEETQDLLMSLEGLKYTFHNNIHGEIEELIVPFEPQSSSIVFKKKNTSSLSSLEYLRQFVGTYEIYGYTIDLVIRDQVLHAIIPGQPVYELVPAGENEFTVKTMTSYLIRFCLNPMNLVDEVLIILPYGAFSARPKCRC